MPRPPKLPKLKRIPLDDDAAEVSLYLKGLDNMIKDSKREDDKVFFRNLKVLISDLRKEVKAHKSQASLPIEAVLGPAVATPEGDRASVAILFKRALEALVASGMTVDKALDLLSQSSLDRIEEIGAKKVADNIVRGAAGSIEVKINGGEVVITGADKVLTWRRLVSMVNQYFSG